MINHVSIGVRDVARTKRFYDAALKPLGYTCLSEGESSLGYGKEAVALVDFGDANSRCRPMRNPACISASTRRAARASRRSMPARSARADATMASPACVPTTGPNYYAAFVVDPDGYRLEAYCGAEAQDLTAEMRRARRISS